MKKRASYSPAKNKKRGGTFATGESRGRQEWNDQSLNDFIRNTLGSEEPIPMEFDRPSLGGGIHRGSSDIIMFSSGVKQSQSQS